jgi:hypothetical protein
MKVTLELDQDVENLIRYIPNSELNGVLVQLIREAITLRMSLTEKPTPISVDELLKYIGKNPAMVEENKSEPELSGVIESIDMSPDFDVDDLGDLAELMK